MRQASFTAFVLIAVFTLGCSKPFHRRHNTLPEGEVVLHLPQSPESSTAGAATPPVDCPLRKQGINPDMLKPFKDTEQYIRFLDRPDRALWQKPDEIINELHLTGSEKIADIGAGSGYFTFRFARAVPAGKVYAVDVEPEMLRHIYHKALTEQVTNIEVIRAAPDDPGIPDDIDLVFICDVLHHVVDHKAWLAALAASMRKGSRLAVVEFKEGDLPEGPPEKIKLPKNKLMSMIVENSFTLDADKSVLLPYQIFLVFSKTN